MRDQQSSRRVRRFMALLLVVMALAVLAPWGGSPSSVSAAGLGNSGAPLTVMTRNVDLGSDLGPVLTATSAAGFVHGVTTTYNEIAASNIPERAAGIAAEIQQTDPAIVSLQEVSLVQRLNLTSTGPVLKDQLDQLASLQAALAQDGLHYSVAAETDEFDFTAPSDAGYYVRLLDRDVILVRSDLPSKDFSFGNVQTGHFTHLLPVQTPLGAVPTPRGWASIDVTVLHTTVRVIATHLEADSASVAAQQAQEILDGPANTSLPVILAGDLNSGPGTTTAAYDVLATHITDTWPAAGTHDAGFTWPLHGEDAFPYATTPTRRIDVILSRSLRPIKDMLIGTNDLTPSGLYPSDHAGVVARFVIDASEDAKAQATP